MSEPEVYKQVVPENGGRTYYYHKVTKKTCWELPPGAVLEKRKEKREPSTEISSQISSSQISQQPTLTSQPSYMSQPPPSFPTELNTTIQPVIISPPSQKNIFTRQQTSPSVDMNLISPPPGSIMRTNSMADAGFVSPPPARPASKAPPFVPPPISSTSKAGSANFPLPPPPPKPAATPVSAASPVRKADSGEYWIECKEVETGKTIWYSNRTNLVVFENPYPKNPPPAPTMTIVSPQPVAKISKPPSAPAIREIDPRWEHCDDGSWYNPVTLQSRDANNPPFLDTMGPVVEQMVYNENPESAAAKLLDYERSGWDFNNARCEIYRARAARVPHTDFAPSIEALVCPRYFSTAPIPALATNTFQMAIKIPDQFVNSKTQIKLTKIVVKPNDTAIVAVELVIKKCIEGLYSENFVLKFVGRDEYVYGEPKILDYEYVRYSLRHQLELNLQLVYMPVRNATKFPMHWLSPSLYAEKYTQIDVLDNEMYRGLSLKAGVLKPNNPAAFMDWSLIPLSELKWPYRVRINDVTNAANLPRFSTQFTEINVKTILHHGNQQIKGSLSSTRGCPFISSPVFYQWLAPQNLMFNQLPRETRVSFMVYGVNPDGTQVLLGYVSQNIVDERGCLISGLKCLKLWPVSGKVEKNGKFDKGSKDDILAYLPQTPVWDNVASDTEGSGIAVQFDEFELPVVAPLIPPVIQINEMQVGGKIAANLIAKPTMQRLDAVAKSDPLKELSDEDKSLMWTHRHLFIQMPAVLPKFLQCVDWSDRQRQAEAHRLLSLWAPLNPYEALELLDSRFPDTTVRQYAVKCISSISDSELAELLLQFTQTLKYEPYHDSSLVRFLIERCLRNPYQLGHFFFWHLKAEMHNVDFCERYGLILEEYLKHAGQHAVELQVQNLIILRLQEAADLIVKLKTVDKKSDEDCKIALRSELSKLNHELPARFQVSLNPRWVAKRLKVEKCKFMSSKKVPLWLVFENADPEGPDIYTIFKSGDDLRQDILTLQLLRMMDRIWLSEQYDLRLKPYSVIATGVNKDGEGVGMIEVVLKSTTISDVQVKYGGGAVGALKDTPLDDYIRDNNADNGQKYEDAVSNFHRSCAGYCVATFVLGIGDRHNGNIMLTESGHLFHIDFGHFLGNFKKKFGFNRERSPFVFTPEMAYVIGGTNYSKSKAYGEFVELCCEAYNSLRKNSSLFISMFILMQTAGMPELQCFEDIYYLRDMLNLQMNDIEASKSFRGEIKASVTEKWRRFDNAIHNMVHG